MKSKFERQMKKEAKQIDCPFVLNDIQDKLGIDPISKKVKFWTKPKILTLSSVVSMAAVTAIIVPVALTTNTTDKYTLATVTLNSSLGSSTTVSTLKSKQGQSSNTSTSDTSDITVSIYLKNDTVVKTSASNSNAQILLSGISDTTSNVESYLNVLTNAAISIGFLDKTNSQNYISLLVYSEDSSYESAILSKMGNGIISGLKTNYVYAYLINEASVNESDETTVASEYEIELQKYKLIAKVLELYPGAYTVEVLASYTIEQLSELLEAKAKDLKINSINSPNYDQKKEEFFEAIKDYIPTLEKYQKRIDELKEIIKSKHIQVEHEYMSYHYRRYLMEKENMPFSIVYSEEMRPIHSTNEEESDEVEELKELVEESKEYIDENIKPIIDSFKQDEDKYIKESEDNFKSTFDKMFEENNHDDRDDEWRDSYSSYYKSDSEYWIVK